MKAKVGGIILAVLACLNLGASSCRADYEWTNEQVIFQGYHGVHPPSLYDGQIAWASDPSNDVTQLTDDQWAHEGSPSLHEGRIAYRTDPEGIMQIAYWGGEGEVPYQVTFGADKRGLPSLYGDRIAYSSKETQTDWDIYYYDCVTEETVRVSDSEWYDFYAVMYGDTIAWIGGITDNRFDVYYWDGSETIMIPSECAMWKPSLYDGQIAWAEVFGYGDDVTTDIMFWDGSEKIKLTSTLGYAIHPSLFQGNIVYTAFDGHDYEIMYWDGVSFYQVTDDDLDNMNPSLYITEEGEIQIAYRRVFDFGTFEGEIVYLTARGPHGDVPEPSVFMMVLSGVLLSLLRFKQRKGVH